jgi:hypothetical protein
VTPTRWIPLAVLIAIGLAVGWVLVDVVEHFAGRVLGVPWLAAAALWVLAIALLSWTLLSRGRIGPSPQGERRLAPIEDGRGGQATPESPMPPLVAARTAALALAASRTGALIGGFYLGITLRLLPVVGTPSGSASAAAAIASVIACSVMVGSALWLERMCRIRDEDPDR